MVWLVVVFLAGCAGQQTAPDDPAGEPVIEPGIYETQTGERLEQDELFEVLAEQRFVVVGEKHDDPWHHEVQARIWQAVSERAPAALGMEMFQRPFQEPLDAYVTGQIDEDQMIEQTEYDDRWGAPLQYYRPLWQQARDEELPIIALNAPRELSREISEVGLDGLTKEERADVPDLDLSNETHRDYVRRAFEQHDME
ncbi:MAG: ChaN family lipoprotein, partial [Persicimonas sp.]